LAARAQHRHLGLTEVIADGADQVDLVEHRGRE
jgi:hypothetical protein